MFLRPCTPEAKKALKESAQARAGKRGTKQALKQYGKTLKWLGGKDEPLEMLKVEYTDRVTIIRKINELITRINSLTIK